MENLWSSIIGNQANIWFAIGFTLLAIEILILGFGSGVLLFGAIGALITGALLWFGVIESQWIYSIACFALATTVATAVLWVPLKKMQSGSEMGQDTSSDLIGNEFRVVGDVTRTSAGKHRYSGTDWQVRLSESSTVDNIADGSLVKVVGVDAGIFHVVPG